MLLMLVSKTLNEEVRKWRHLKRMRRGETSAIVTTIAVMSALIVLLISAHGYPRYIQNNNSLHHTPESQTSKLRF